MTDGRLNCVVQTHLAFLIVVVPGYTLRNQIHYMHPVFDIFSSNSRNGVTAKRTVDSTVENKYKHVRIQKARINGLFANYIQMCQRCPIQYESHCQPALFQSFNVCQG